MDSSFECFCKYFSVSQNESVTLIEFVMCQVCFTCWRRPQFSSLGPCPPGHSQASAFRKGSYFSVMRDVPYPPVVSPYTGVPSSISTLSLSATPLANYRRSRAAIAPVSSTSKVQVHRPGVTMATLMGCNDPASIQPQAHCKMRGSSVSAPNLLEGRVPCSLWCLRGFPHKTCDATFRMKSRKPWCQCRRFSVTCDLAIYLCALDLPWNC